MDKRIEDDFSKGRFDRTEEGIYFPESSLLVQGVFKYNKRGEPEETSKNLVVNQGLDHILATGVGKIGIIANWYIAAYIGVQAVDASWTALDFHTQCGGEFTNTVAATRPGWDISAATVASGGIDSFSAKSEFESTQMGESVTGAALISVSAFGSSPGGTLIAASNFGSAKGLDTGEILDIGYGLQLTAV
jgi:hypothetical protein